jgi:two-component system LytT family response regulator
MPPFRAIVADDEPLSRDKLRRWLIEHSDFNVVAAVGDGIGAVQSAAKLLPDVIFLDIHMPGLNGLEVAAQLQSTTAPLVVFVTAFGDYALQAFDLNAIDYLVKPYDKERFLRTLGRLRDRIPNGKLHAKAVQFARQHTAGSNRLLVPDGAGQTLIERDSILWLKADDNYVHVHCINGRYMVRRTLQDLLVQLGATQFVRIHKSTAVQVVAIASINPLLKGDYEVQLRDGEKLRLSRRYKRALFGRLGR